MTAYFTKDLFAFLKDLKANNDRDWFNANKARYEKAVKEPFLRFITDVGPKLETISPHLIADPKPQGGSFFRIYRDTRFAKDKSPYKTNAAAHFWSSEGEGAPGYYLSLAPGQCFAGGGVWRPEPAALGAIRDAIVAKPDRWAKARAGLDIHGESLSRPPRGYAPDHAAIEDIKRKSFAFGFEVKDDEVTGSDFLDRYIGYCRKGAPLLGFLAEAAGTPW
jgi:uncharacterized protein (TIGR02453 family)